MGENGNNSNIGTTIAAEETGPKNAVCGDEGAEVTETGGRMIEETLGGYTPGQPGQYGEKYLNPELVQILHNKMKHYPHHMGKGVDYCDLFSLTEDPLALAALTESVRRLYDPNSYDAIVAIGARGFILAGMLLETTRKPVIPARKEGKLPGPVVQIPYSDEYKVEKMEMSANALQPGARVVIVDDLAATGGTALAVYILLKYHFKCKVTGVLVVTNLAYLRQDKDVFQENGIELRAILHMTEKPVLPPYDPDKHIRKVIIFERSKAGVTEVQYKGASEQPAEGSGDQPDETKPPDNAS